MGRTLSPQPGLRARAFGPGITHHHVGGWGQVNVEVSPMFRFGGGCGADKPDENALATTARLHNQACSGYTILRPGGPIFIGAEYRRLETRYSSGTVANNHINLAVGFEF